MSLNPVEVFPFYFLVVIRRYYFNTANILKMFPIVGDNTITKIPGASSDPTIRIPNWVTIFVSF